MDFRLFLENENEKDIKDSLRRLPKKWANLVKGFNFEFQTSNSLKGDKKHVGMVDTVKKKITLSNAYFHAQEFVFLHELSHLIYNRLTQDFKSKWSKIVAATPKHPKDNDEELFCHAFATTYSKHPPTTYNFKSWIKFIKKLAN